MKMKFIAVIFLCIGLAGCATTGMSQVQSKGETLADYQLHPRQLEHLADIPYGKSYNEIKDMTIKEKVLEAISVLRKYFDYLGFPDSPEGGDTLHFKKDIRFEKNKSPYADVSLEFLTYKDTNSDKTITRLGCLRITITAGKSGDSKAYLAYLNYPLDSEGKRVSGDIDLTSQDPKDLLEIEKILDIVLSYKHLLNKQEKLTIIKVDEEEQKSDKKN